MTSPGRDSLNPSPRLARVVTTAQLVEEVRSKGATLYGAGFVARTFFSALEDRGLAGHVRGCLVSGTPSSGEKFCGLDVRRAADADLSSCGVICVSVHGASLPQVEEVLGSLGAEDVVWVYPCLFELVFGEPVRRGERVRVSDLLAAQDPTRHWISVRAVAARGIIDGTRSGDDTYLRAMSLHAGEASARLRLGRLAGLVRSMRERGYDEESPIVVDEDMRVVDGLHRVAVAWLLGMPEVTCDVVRRSERFGQVFGDRCELPVEMLAEAGLSDDEIGAVLSLSRRMGTGAAAPEVSVILPAYNVAGYLDQCMRSIVSQTHVDFEAIAVDDGSGDDTASRLEAWAAQDERIRVVRAAHGGVSAARNLGLELARGTWVAFVDPDDWVDEEYLEVLLAKARQEQADLVECDLWRYDTRTGKSILRHCGQRMGVAHTREEHMRLGPTASYKSISLRSLWMDNDVRFPGCSFESPAVYALVLALARRTAYVPRPMYHYRRFREGSLVETGYARPDGTPDEGLGVDAMRELVSGFRRCGLYGRYVEALPGIVSYRLNDILAMQYHRRSKRDFQALVSSCRKYLGEEFPNLDNRPYLTWGGYNLNRVLGHLSAIHDPSCRFNFSSVAAVCGTCAPAADVSHPNRYRELMLRREMARDVWEALGEVRPAWVFLDLVEERHDLVEWQGRILTASDALAGAEVELVGARTIPRGSAECEQVMTRSLDEFCSRLRAASPATRLVVVEDYLTERVGDMAGSEPWPQDVLAGVRRTNALLRGYYAQLRELCGDALWVDATAAGGYLTDRDYEYGAMPSHVNDIANQRIAEMIEEAMA